MTYSWNFASLFYFFIYKVCIFLLRKSCIFFHILCLIKCIISVICNRWWASYFFFLQFFNSSSTSTVFYLVPLWCSRLEFLHVSIIVNFVSASRWTLCSQPLRLFNKADLCFFAFGSTLNVAQGRFPGFSSIVFRRCWSIVLLPVYVNGLCWCHSWFF